jgi:hypothetical protein
LPDALSVSKKDMLDYVVKFRAIVENAVSGEQKNQEKGMPNVKFNVLSTSELFADVVEIKAQLTFGANVQLKHGSKTEYVCVAEVILNIASVMIKSEGYWYPYDVFPEITPA